METTITILSILCLMQFLFIINMINKNWNLRSKSTEMKEKISKMQEEKAKKEETDIIPGDKVAFDYHLKFADKHEFSVTYEAEVTEVSKDRIKVSAYSVTNTTKIPHEMINTHPDWKKIVNSYMTDKWIDRKETALILNKDEIRNKKLGKLLS